MKKSTLTKAGASILGFSFAFAMPTYAATYNIGQADLNNAVGGDNSKNINCSNTELYCTMEGNYTLTENVDTRIGGDLYTLDLEGNTTLDLNSHTLKGVISNKEAGAEVTVKNGTITEGEIDPNGATNFTLTDITATDAKVEPVSSTVNITSGTYTSTTGQPTVKTGKDSTINISNGTFESTGAWAPTIMAFNEDTTKPVNLNISGGTFTSAGYSAIDFNNEAGWAEGTVNTTISGGTFTGKTAALSIMDPSLNNLKLTGGTYKYTGSDADDYGAIMIFGDNSAAISGFLASGYHYTDGTTANKQTSWGSTVTVIEGPTSVVADSSENNTTDPTESTSSNTSSTTKKSGIKAPDTGTFTSEGESASATSSLLTFAIITLLGLITYKKFSKRS